MFELLVAEAPAEELTWVDMANDELRYALPKFEAQMLILNGGFEPQQIATNQQRAVMLYRQILADNSDNPMRVVEINGQLDGLAASQVALKRAMQYQAMANSGALRMQITQHYMMMGEWPSKSELEQLLSESMTRLEIVDYQLDGQQMQLKVKDARSGSHVTLLGKQGEVRLQ